MEKEKIKELKETLRRGDMKDISFRSGISQETISKFFNCQSVSRMTEDNIIDTVKKMNLYRSKEEKHLFKKS